MVRETNAFRAGDEHFSAGDKRVEKQAFELQPHTHS